MEELGQSRALHCRAPRCAAAPYVMKEARLVGYSELTAGPRPQVLVSRASSTGRCNSIVADLDSFLNGAGVLVPQTDTSAASFAGNYAFGTHNYNYIGEAGWEVDYIGQGSVADGVFTGTGLASDPSSFFDGTNTATDSGVTFSGTATPDLIHAGRYTLVSNGLAVTVSGWGTYNYATVVIYQASGGQLFWMNEDFFTLFLGSFQQQAPLNGLPGAKYATVTRHPKQKQ